MATKMEIKGEGLTSLAILTAELVKQNVGFVAVLTVPQREEWLITFTGAC